MEEGEQKVVKTIDKGMGGQIQIRLSRFHERNYIDIRNFYEADDGEWKPTRKGIAIPVELYEELMDGLKAAQPLLSSMPESPGA